MRLATITAGRGTTAAVEHEGQYALLPYSDVSELLRTSDWRDDIHRILTTGPEMLDGRQAHLRAVVPAPGKIVCCGLNYGDHIREMGRDLPEYPTLFAKYADVLTGPEDEITVRGSERIDWEAELAVVIGDRVHEADESRAARAIAGYTVANDISMRDWQNRTLQWFQGKNFVASTPLGPVLTTTDEFGASPTFRVQGWVNDDLVQDGDTATLVFPPATLVSYISQFIPLEPGDVVLTGTPGGVGSGMKPPRFAQCGDVLTTHIEGLGTLTNRVLIK